TQSSCFAAGLPQSLPAARGPHRWNSLMIRSALLRFVVGALVVTSLSATHAADWKPMQAPLMTRWAKDVEPKKPLPQYPRPQMTRDRWQNLNGLWDYAIRPKDDARPERWDGEIL